MIIDELATRKTLCDIARSAFEIVNQKLDADQRLARELRSNDTTSRQIVREESITEAMAIALRERFPQHVEVTLFTPQEETRIGADWYWRIERGDHAIHARVQAKRVQRTEFGAADFDGHVDIDLEQLLRLCEAARSAAKQLPGLGAWFATYARVDATPPCRQMQLQRCELHHHSNSCADEQPSLWIGNAQEFAKVNRQHVPVSEIISHSVRLDCVLPCIEAAESRRNDGPAYKGFVLGSGLQSYQQSLAVIQSDPGLSSGFVGALRIY